MTYTHTNLRDVIDAAPRIGVGATQEMRFAQRALDAERTGLSLMTVRPGLRQAIAHRHEQAEEIYVVLSGSGRTKLDDDIVSLAPLDAIRLALPSPGRSREAQTASNTR